MMRMVDLIAKKRDGYELATEEIDFIIQNYTKDLVPDYQMSALTMAIYFRGMTERERTDLTMAMARSGEQVDLSSIEGIKVDKHSTGGVGDSTTLILAPLVASAGVPVAKMSGRGLGHTGGTIDKLESVPGFHAEIDKNTFIDLVNKNKLAVVSQSGNMTPADKKLYALRDVTATVDSLPLIASSIMSKKIAAGADAIVLDVKTGNGAFMKTYEEAGELARAMVQIGNTANRKTMAVISDMSQPLGFAVGNALEVKEAIDTLRGEGPRDLTELCLTLGSYMVLFGKKATDLESARRLLEQFIADGTALQKFKAFLESQGGDSSVVDEPEKLPQAKYKISLLSETEGYISEMSAEDIGLAAMLLGAGRAEKASVIDLAAGIVLQKKIGDPVSKGEALAVIHSNTEYVEPIKEKLYESIKISNHKPAPPPLIHGIISE